MHSEFPDYYEIASPKPVNIQEAQKILSVDEALIVYVIGRTLIATFIVTNDRIFYRALIIDKRERNQIAALSRYIDAFRRGLDTKILDQQLGVYEKTGVRPDLFDLNVAHALYDALMGSAEAVIKDKRHLIVVPSGPLTTLPVHLLVTEKPPASAPSPET
jgi:hypothetical protein